jgi:hypothetical protein
MMNALSANDRILAIIKNKRLTGTLFLIDIQLKTKK